MSPFSRPRRFAIAAAALALGAVLLRGQIAEALSARGDEYLYRALPADALERYRRALAIDPDTRSAADRFVFVSMEQHSLPALRSGIAVANRYLSKHPSDGILLSDRALCFLIERNYGDAERDFESAARAHNDPQMYLFAGWSAWHQGRNGAARTLWHRALLLEPRNAAVLKALREHSDD